MRRCRRPISVPTTDRARRIVEGCGFTFWKELAQPGASTLGSRCGLPTSAARASSRAAPSTTTFATSRAFSGGWSAPAGLRRCRWAHFKAREGLAIDPLDEDLTWVAAHAIEFLVGPIESRSLFDRFLALRGLRAHDYRTLKGRDLDGREEEALEVVQRPLMPARGGKF